MSFKQIVWDFMPHFLYSQFFLTPTYPRSDCTGKTYIVTGANTGLGREAARHFVRLNAAKVIIACRSLDKGEAAKRDIESATGRVDTVEVWSLDLGSYESVKHFAEKTKSLKRLDGVIENAGINTGNFVNVEDNESTITVNVVSTFLLALLLLPVLQQSGGKHNITPTLTIVSSDTQFISPFTERREASIFDALNSKEKTVMSQRYPTSKLLEVLICREIARLHPVEQTKVTLNLCNPGLCYSELNREMDSALLGLMMRLLARTTEEGARTLVHAGLAAVDTHGKYLSNTRIEACAPLVESPEGPEVQKRVWNELAAKLNAIQPGVTKVLDA